MIIELKPRNYSLENTFQPSFISSLFIKRGDEWVKVTGFLKGLRMTLRDGVLRAEFPGKVPEEALLNEVLLETGLWIWRPFEERLGRIKKSYREVIKLMAEKFSGVRLPVSKRDFKHIFIAAALSKRTDYHKFVLNWCKLIWRKTNDLKNMNLNLIKAISPSYQLRDLAKSLMDLKLKVDVNALLEKSPEEARVELIGKCWGIGPKVADSIILTTFKAPHFLPCDTHLRTVLGRLGFTPQAKRLPSSNYCSKFTCTEEASIKTRIALCPLADDCLRPYLQSIFKDLSGWVQTLAYLFGKAYCRALKPKCRDCTLKSYCSLKNKGSE